MRADLETGYNPGFIPLKNLIRCTINSYIVKSSESRTGDAEQVRVKGLKIGLLLRQAREQKHLTQQKLGELVDKQPTYISRVQNDRSNTTL